MHIKKNTLRSTYKVILITLNNVLTKLLIVNFSYF